MMPTLRIDNQPVTVPDGTTILKAAAELGIEIPTLCWAEGIDPSVSCMLCAVEVEGMSRLIPSCATPVREGMIVRTDTPAVQEHRRLVLELLLSHHTGDCDAPCTLVCPAGFRVPEMLRLLQEKRLVEAASLAAAQLALPRTLGRICPAPCEKACRRRDHDGAVAIPVLHGTAAASVPPRLSPNDATGQRVAVVGAGPAGLGAALALRLLGHEVDLLETEDTAGGNLRRGPDPGKLPPDDLDADIAVILGAGVRLRAGTAVGTPAELLRLRENHGVVILATGSGFDVSQLGLESGPKGVSIDRETQMTSIDGVFAAGGAVREIRKMAVRAIASGQVAAHHADRYLRGILKERAAKPVNVSMGTLRDGELSRFLIQASPCERQTGADTREFLDAERAASEAVRCLHCDCRAADDCRLREYATRYGADASRWRNRRPPFEQDFSHPDVIFEPGKCITCGLCIQVTRKAGEPLGQAFLGRGIAVRIAPPFGESLKAALSVSAEECVRICPTGALAFR